MFGGAASEKDSINIIHRALDEGINFVDTANVYNNGVSERILGKAILGRRDEMVLATKVYVPMGKGPNDRGSSRYHILKALNQSLEHLNTDHIDIYFLHEPDYDTAIEETLRTLDDCVNQGKVRYIGCSNFYAWQIMEGLAVSDRMNFEKYACAQPLYNIANRDAEVELLPLCQKYGVGVASYSPLARGVLSGKYRNGEEPPKDSRAARGDTRIRVTEWREESFNVAQKLKMLADAHGITQTQLALAWVLANPVISSAIIGPRTMEQLEDNLGSLSFTLTSSDEKAVDELVRPGEHTGRGYNDPNYPVRGRPVR
jgi:aryl-alcohol dehydrogenase-like predicted oxidoreductase